MLRTGARIGALARVPRRGFFGSGGSGDGRNTPFGNGPPSMQNVLHDVQRRFQELERDIFGGRPNPFNPFSSSHQTQPFNSDQETSPYSSSQQTSPFSGGQQTHHDSPSPWRPFSSHPTDNEAFRAKNPIVEENGRRMFKMEFDVRRFKPEDIKVTTDKATSTLSVEAKHQDAETRFEYSRRLTVPAGVTLAEITCSTLDGVLVFEAPYNEPQRADLPKEQTIVIDHK